METYVFSFGFGHHCECGRALANCYTRIDGADAESARARMCSVWGQKWAFQYASAAEAGADRGDLRLIVTNFDNPLRCKCGRGPKPARLLVDLRCADCEEQCGAALFAVNVVAPAPPPVICESCRERLRTRAPDGSPTIAVVRAPGTD